MEINYSNIALSDLVKMNQECRYTPPIQDLLATVEDKENKSDFERLRAKLDLEREVFLGNLRFRLKGITYSDYEKLVRIASAEVRVPRSNKNDYRPEHWSMVVEELKLMEDDFPCKTSCPTTPTNLSRCDEPIKLKSTTSVGPCQEPDFDLPKRRPSKKKTKKNRLVKTTTSLSQRDESTWEFPIKEKSISRVRPCQKPNFLPDGVLERNGKKDTSHGVVGTSSDGGNPQAVARVMNYSWEKNFRALVNNQGGYVQGEGNGSVYLFNDCKFS